MTMYKRPYPYSSFYYPQPMHQEHPYYEHPMPQQSYYSQQDYYPNASPYGFVPHYKTPFEQFAKPKQPMNWYPKQQQQFYYPPPQSNKPNHQSHQVNNLKAYFQDSNGQVDFDKMFSTVGQLANTVQQVSPVIKQFGSLIKSFK